MEILSKLIRDGKCVTKLSLLRQTSLNTDQVQNVMKEFYDKHKHEVSATFLIFGTPNNDSVWQSILCCEDTLEETKRRFDAVHSISIYSIQKSPATIQTLLNADFSGKYKEPVEAYPHRLRIVSSLALEAQKTWNKRNPNPIYSTYEIPEFVSQAKREALAKKSIFIKSDQHKIKDAFAIAVHNNKEIDEAMETEQFDNNYEEMRPSTSKNESIERKRKSANFEDVENQTTDARVITRSMRRAMAESPKKQSSISSFFKKV